VAVVGFPRCLRGVKERRTTREYLKSRRIRENTVMKFDLTFEESASRLEIHNPSALSSSVPSALVSSQRDKMEASLKLPMKVPASLLAFFLLLDVR